MKLAAAFAAPIMTLALIVAAPTVIATPAAGQALHPQGTEAQRKAMEAFAWMDGEWRGTAEAMTGPGQTHTVVHTERIGPMLGGSIKIIEGRSYNADGSVAFNAFAVLSWDEANSRYVMRSYANGQAQDFPLEGGADGFRWTVPSRGGEIRYVTTYKDGEWNELGHFVAEGREPMQVVKLMLRRTGDTGWPAANPVPPTP